MAKPDKNAPWNLPLSDATFPPAKPSGLLKMNTTTLRPLVIIACLAARYAVAQPNNVAIPSSPPSNTNYIMVLITNWYDPEPGLRTVNGLIYNPTYAQIWQTVIIPIGAAAINPTYNGTVQPINLTFQWGPVEGREHQTVTINNFPYDPRDFRRDHDNPYSHIITAHAFALRVLPVNIQTNWTPLGRMWIGQRTYDYGVPYTGKIPIATWQRVPVDQAPQKTNLVTRIPKHRPNLSIKAYTEGPLPDRLEAIQNLEPASRRDDYLLQLAGDAAKQDDLPTTEQALGDIANSMMRDSAAQLAAMTLARAGRAGDAYAVVTMITNPARRTAALAQIHQQNQ